MAWKIQPGESPRPPYWDFSYEEWGTDEDDNIAHLKYGRWFPVKEDWTSIDIELLAFLEGWNDLGALGKYQHGVNAVNLIWNSGEKPNIIWTPEMEKMFKAACEYKKLGITGPASCNKSHFGALWALLNFYAKPEMTMVIMTSTSVTAAKQRCWASVVKLYNAMPKDLRLKAKMVGSNGILRYREIDDDMATTDARGITLVAAEAKQDANAVGKLIGRKSERMIFVADELPELSPSILTAQANLQTNPDFQFIALGNAKDCFDPFGKFCTPLNGWASINENTEEWDIRGGKVIHFDALKSTNYVTGRQVYPFMPSFQTIEDARDEYGENSLTFFRMYRGFFPPSGAVESCYSSYDLAKHIQSGEPDWEEVNGKKLFTDIAGADLSFVSDGDKTVLTHLRVGRGKDSKWRVYMVKQEIIKENILAKQESRTASICSQIKRYLDEHKIEYQHFAYDSTGGGAPWGDYMMMMLGARRLIPIHFGGKASEMIGNGVDRRPAYERYSNRCTEIWFSANEFLRGEQLYNVSDKICEELTMRRYRSGERGKLMVEPKKDMKLASGRSPDFADSYLLTLTAAMEKLHINSQERRDRIPTKKQFHTIMKKLDIVTASSGGRPDWEPMSA